MNMFFFYPICVFRNFMFSSTDSRLLGSSSDSCVGPLSLCSFRQPFTTTAPFWFSFTECKFSIEQSNFALLATLIFEKAAFNKTPEWRSTSGRLGNRNNDHVKKIAHHVATIGHKTSISMTSHCKQTLSWISCIQGRDFSSSSAMTF